VLSQERLLALIGRIYDAGADQSLWSSVLEDIADALNANSTTALVYHDLAALQANFIVSARSDPECERRYIEQYSAFDPFREASLAPVSASSARRRSDR
jgi:hypothetical protein